MAPSFAPVLARAECSSDSVRDSAGARCCAASRGSGAERVRRKTSDRGAPAPVTACSTMSCASDHASMPMTGTAARTAAGLRSAQRNVADPFPDRLAATGRHAEEGAAGEGQAGKVSNGTQPRLPPGVSELRLQNSRA